ncbi:ribbon-helix-helix protein, CopG family [Microbacterium sp.]|uniref:ribbon-helix-helix protein, CopG family n=1 Tax=Microbacterium sp. TaxID=51671 RepID=UPI003F975514
MAMNLRLRDDAAEALRAEAERTGLSQQEILRRAVDEHLGLAGATRPTPYPDWVIPPERPYRSVTPTLRLPAGMTTADLLDREDRI